jgi:virulence-associated protein E/primase-like protein
VAFGVIFASESEGLSLAYFIGSVAGRPPIRVEVVDGAFVDTIELPDAPPVHEPAQREQRIKNGPPADRAEVAAALNAITGKDDYGSWLKVGAGLFDEFGDDGYDLFRDWSARSPKFSERDTQRKWRDAQKMTQITIATVFSYAKEANPNWRRTFNGPQPDQVNLADASSKPPTTIGTVKKVGLHTSDKGMPRPLLINAVAKMSGPEWQDVVVYDEFSLKIFLQQAPPWAAADKWTPRYWTPYDDLKLCEWLQSRFVYVPLRIAEQAVALVAESHKVHPVRQYLGELHWDGVPRLDSWVHDFLGVEDNRYSRAVGAKTLISAVARVRDPGCKVDTATILEGRQGALKSTALRALFRPWFTDEISDFGSKDAAMQMLGVWGIEVAELDAMSRAETSRTKAFVSRQTDHYRPPYGTKVIDVPRQSIFIGTANSDNYLKDETGARRFLPLRIGRIDISHLEAVRDQLWAEATHRYMQGEKWWLESDLVRLAQREQAERYVGDSWDEPVHEFLSTVQESTSVAEIFQYLGIDERDQSQVHQNRISRIMKSIGWERFRSRTGQQRHWRYRKGPFVQEIEDAALDHAVLNTTQHLNPFIIYAGHLRGLLEGEVPD